MFWTSVKSGLRQIYVGALAFVLVGIVDMATTLDVPADTKYAIVISAVLMIVKTFEKAIRQAVLKWVKSLD